MTKRAEPLYANRAPYALRACGVHDCDVLESATTQPVVRGNDAGIRDGSAILEWRRGVRSPSVAVDTANDL